MSDNNQTTGSLMANGVSLFKAPIYKWQCAPTGDFFALSLHFEKAPNAFHRLMQRLVLGIKYRRIKP